MSILSTKSADLPEGWEDLPDSSRPTMLAIWQQNQMLAQQVDQLGAELQEARRSSIRWEQVFHPLSILAVSLSAALAFAALIVLDGELNQWAGRHLFFLYYMVPISAPFVAFLMDRAERWQKVGAVQWAVDLPVIVIGLVRALYALPGISGHALFLTYAILTVRSPVARLMAVIVMAEVIYFKIFAWHDATIFGGMALATAAAGIFYFLQKRARAIPV